MAQIEQLLTSIESNYEQWAPSFASSWWTHCLMKMRGEVALLLADYRDVLDKVVIPCDVIQTRNDIIVPVSVAKYVQIKVKRGGEVEIIDTEGHFPQLTAHVEFVEVLDRILGC